MQRRSRASSSGRARAYRQAGHDNALLFALELGLGEDYKNDHQAKKDVIDPSGDAHSVKSGGINWQLFLYRRNRFLTDDGFLALNGIGLLLVHCIDAFPPSFEEYRNNPDVQIGIGQMVSNSARQVQLCTTLIHQGSSNSEVP